MKKTVSIAFLTVIFAMMFASVAFAAEEAAGLPEKVGFAVALAAGFGIGIAAFGGAIGQGMAIKGAMEGISRNPGASGKIMTPMIIGLAMIESLVIYSLVVSLILVFKV